MQDPHEPPAAPESPYDADGRVGVPGAEGWRYTSIHGDGGNGLAVGLAGPGDVGLEFAVPAFLSRGDELGEVARIVIRAWERKERSEGLGA